MENPIYYSQPPVIEDCDREPLLTQQSDQSNKITSTLSNHLDTYLAWMILSDANNQYIDNLMPQQTFLGLPEFQPLIAPKRDRKLGHDHKVVQLFDGRSDGPSSQNSSQRGNAGNKLSFLPHFTKNYVYRTIYQDIIKYFQTIQHLAVLIHFPRKT